MSFWNTLRIGASALSAQRLRLDVIANNVANVETTRTEEGGPYKRADVVFIPKGSASFLPAFLRRHRADGPSLGEGGVKVAAIIRDDTPGPRVYDPDHPDADEEGYVTYPNVNLVVEMTNMISASRSYQASLAVIEAAREMALRALEIVR